MKAGRSLESYVQFVYQKLLEFMEEGDAGVHQCLHCGKDRRPA